MRILCKIELSRTTPSPNEMLRWHWTQRHKLKLDYGWSLVAEGARDKKNQAKDKEKRRVEIYSYRKQLLDPDNLYGSVKLLLDAMIDMKLIYDDSLEYLSLSVYQEIDKKNPRTEIVIYVLDDEKFNKKGGC